MESARCVFSLVIVFVESMLFFLPLSVDFRSNPVIESDREQTLTYKILIIDRFSSSFSSPMIHYDYSFVLYEFSLNLQHFSSLSSNKNFSIDDLYELVERLTDSKLSERFPFFHSSQIEQYSLISRFRIPKYQMDWNRRE